MITDPITTNQSNLDASRHPGRRWARTGVSALALALALAACGSSSDSDDGATGADSTPTTATDTAASGADTPATADDAATDTPATDDAAAPAEGQAVSLGEWFVTVDGDVAAGSQTFAISNSGEMAHALAIVKGDAYESLPQLDNGAVDTETLGADFLGGTDRIDAGATGTLTIDLEPGNYVFFCPIAFGPNSHAKAGQVLSVTVQ